MLPYILRGHSKPITSLVFNKDGDLLYVSSKDKVVSCWYTKSGELLGSFQHKGSVNGVSVNFNTTRVATACATGEFLIWDAKTGIEITSVNVSVPVKSVEFSENGNELLVLTERISKTPSAVSIYSMPKEVLESTKVYKGQQWKSKESFQFHDTKATCCCWGPSSQQTIIVGCEDGSVRIFRVDTHEQLTGITEHKNSITRVATSPDKLFFITSSADNSARLYDCLDFKHLKTYSASEPVNSAAISPTKNLVVIGGGTSAVDVTTTMARVAYFEARIFHLVFEEEIGTVKAHFGPIHCLSWSPDGMSFASGGEDGM